MMAGKSYRMVRGFYRYRKTGISHVTDVNGAGVLARLRLKT